MELKFAVGEVLENGAVVILMEADSRFNDRAFVLAHVEKGEFVTWAVNEEGHTTNGHYFPYGEFHRTTPAQALAQATKDILERAGVEEEVAV